MVKHTQTIHLLLPTNCLSVFDHFVGLALQGLETSVFLLFLRSVEWDQRNKVRGIPSILYINEYNAFKNNIQLSQEPVNLISFYMTWALVLTHFWPMFPFYAPWKDQKIFDFSCSHGFQKEILARDGLNELNWVFWWWKSKQNMFFSILVYESWSSFAYNLSFQLIVLACNLLFQFPVHHEFTTSWQAYPLH